MADYHPLLIDKRIIERNIHKGLISRNDYEKYLEGLPDSEQNAEVVQFEPPEPEGEGDDERS
ncbi:MAG: hypothetical protein ACOCV4_08450 [Myxococcota bacterium]